MSRRYNETALALAEAAAKQAATNSQCGPCALEGRIELRSQRSGKTCRLHSATVSVDPLAKARRRSA